MNTINLIFRRPFFLMDFDSSDDDAEEEDIQFKIENFCEEIVRNYSEFQFKENFRMSISTFNSVCKDMHDLEISMCRPGRIEMQIEKQIMIELWFFGNRETLRSIAGRFGCVKSTAWIIINNFARKLLKLNLQKKIIYWPSMDEKQRTSDHFNRKYKFRGVIGAIDGTHIPVIAPVNSPNSFVCRKGFHSLVLQAVCNEKMEFIQTYAGEAGSIHDARVFLKSDLPSRVSSGSASILAEEHLLGDSAYPLKVWLMTPFKNNGNLEDSKITYNIIHSKCRVVVERAFGLLKGRFRRLKYLDTRKPALAPLYIGASCILHNYILKFSVVDEQLPLDDILVNDIQDNEVAIDDNDSDSDIDLISDNANLKRLAIVNELF